MKGEPITEFISRCYGNKEFEVIIKTDDSKHYDAAIGFARKLIDHEKPMVPGHENLYDISEMAYRNGYAQGLEDGKLKWIPVSERLPVLTEEESAMIEANILTAAPEFNVMIAGATKATTLYYVGDGCWFDGGDTFYPVTHWSSLPKPPAAPEERCDGKSDSY